MYALAKAAKIVTKMSKMCRREMNSNGSEVKCRVHVIVQRIIAKRNIAHVTNQESDVVPNATAKIV